MTETAATQARWNARVWALAGPIIVSNISTPLLGAVDTAVVGHLPDPAYIGGVAVGAVIFNFLFWGFGFLRMGTTGFTAQALGAGDRAELRAILARALLLAALLGALLILLQGPIGWVSFLLFEASDQVEGFARSYYEIRIWSAPAALANYAMLGWLLGTRRAGAVLLIQVVLNGINIILDLVFVLGLGWGVEGVALASLLAELAAMVLGLTVVARALRGDGGAWDWPRIAARERLAVLLRANLNILVRTLCLVLAFAYFTARSATMGDVLLAGGRLRPRGGGTGGQCAGRTQPSGLPRGGARLHPLGARHRRGDDRPLPWPRRADRRAVHRHRDGASGGRGLSAMGRRRAAGVGLEFSARRHLHRHHADP